MDDDRSRMIKTEQMTEWSDEQLRQLLLAQMDAPKVDVDLVRRITAILAAREEENGHEIDPRTALETFKREYKTTPALYLDEEEAEEESSEGAVSRPHVRARKLVRVVAVAAVIAVLFLGITIVANANGLDLWGVVTTWTSDFFGITKAETDTETLHSEQYDTSLHLKTILEERGVSQAIVPNYIPEGYSFAGSDYTDTFEGFYAECVLDNGENEILFRYWIPNTDQTNHFYAIDDAEPEIYERAGIEHYIMTNEDVFIVSWKNESVLCDISGVQSYDELIQMINSIYEKDD